MRLHLSGIGAAFLAVGIGTFAAAQQTSTDNTADATVSGCLQRAPSTMAKEGRFMLMNASNSPLGGSATQDVAPPAVKPPQPARGDEPIQHRTGEADARQETGGLNYLLQAGRDLSSSLESKIGQRVEVTGTIEGELRLPPTAPTAARPVQKLKVKRVRAITSAC